MLFVDEHPAHGVPLQALFHIVKVDVARRQALPKLIESREAGTEYTTPEELRLIVR